MCWMLPSCRGRFAGVARALALGVAMACGCGPARHAAPAGPRLSAGDFQDPRAAGVPPPVLPGRAARVTPAEAGFDTGVFEATGRTGAPELSPDAVATQAPALVDATVGHINGRAVYASEFLAPLEAELRAKARELPAEEWRQLAAERIQTRLSELIRDELLRAEQLARLTPEERQGLQFFLEQLRKRERSRNYGSAQRTSRALMESEGLTEDEFLKQREERTLIELKIHELRRRVQVSQREIEEFYERNYRRFNPEPSAVFRLIAVDPGAEGAVDAVNARLAAGEPFASVAASELNTFQRESGGLIEAPIRGAFAETEFFGIPEWNEAARTLTPGQWAPGLSYGSSPAWLYLERIRQESRTLFEAQTQIEDEIRTAKVRDELNRFIVRLQERASFTDQGEMTRRLVSIADERFGPRRAAPGVGAPATGP